MLIGEVPAPDVSEAVCASPLFTTRRPKAANNSNIAKFQQQLQQQQAAPRLPEQLTTHSYHAPRHAQNNRGERTTAEVADTHSTPHGCFTQTHASNKRNHNNTALHKGQQCRKHMPGAVAKQHTSFWQPTVV